MINLFNGQSLEKTFDKFSVVFALLLIVMLILMCCAVVKKVFYSESQNTSCHKCCHVELTPNDTLCIKVKRNSSDKE